MATVRIEYYGMDGVGRNVTEAKRDAGAKIENALSGDYSPIIVRANGEAVLIFREPRYGWGYALLHPDTHGLLRSNGSTYDERDEAERKARSHLAQIVFSYDGPDGSEVIEDKHDLEEHKRWVAWQRLYRKWRDAGVADYIAHSNACRGLEPSAHTE